MDGPPAQSLTFEGLSTDAMKEPPRNPNTPVIDQPMISMYYVDIGDVLFTYVDVQSMAEAYF